MIRTPAAAGIALALFVVCLITPILAGGWGTAAADRERAIASALADYEAIPAAVTDLEVIRDFQTGYEEGVIVTLTVSPEDVAGDAHYRLQLHRDSPCTLPAALTLGALVDLYRHPAEPHGRVSIVRSVDCLNLRSHIPAGYVGDEPTVSTPIGDIPITNLAIAGAISTTLFTVLVLLGLASRGARSRAITLKS